MIMVNVINEQNTAPTIDVNFVSASTGNGVDISEDVKVGSFIAYVKVTDHDTGQNGEVSCDLKHDKFNLQNMGIQKYQVVVKKTLDRETEDLYGVTINCQDKGSPPLKSESKFSIRVTDVNDVQPQFAKQSFKFFIDENQRSKIPVGTINATDPDLGLGGKLSFSLLTKNKQFVPFRITENGLISSIMSLDHEFQDTYKFQVFVKDKGTPSLNNTVNVMVKVRDENDNAPYFTVPSVNPYNMDVTYYPHHTKNITQIKASDSDSQENAFLKYEIIRGNGKQIFIINQYTGLLSSTHVLSQQDAGSYELEFLVKDSGSPVLSARTTVYLTLTVSNKTSEMLNAVNIKTDNKIHLTSAIIIVSVAVIIAVIITASISVCILRCCNPLSVPVAEGSYVSGQRHLIGPPYPANPWSDVAVPTTDANMRRSSQLPTPRVQSHPYSSNQQILSSPVPKPQPTSHSVPQMYVQDLALPSGRDKSKRTVRTQGYSSRCSIKSTHNESRQDWGEENTINPENISDVYSSQYCNPSPLQYDQQQTTEMRPLGQTVNYPSDTTIVARGFCTPYMNEDSLHKEVTNLKADIDSDTNTSSQHLQIKNNFANINQTCNSRPLPPVPH